MAATNLISAFLNWVLKYNSQYQDLDRVYLQNHILTLIGGTDPAKVNGVTAASPIALANALVDYAVEQGTIGTTLPERDILAAQLLDLLTPLPSAVNQQFWRRHDQQSPEAATEYFYQLSTANDYVKTAQIAKNIKYSVATDYGDLEITINLSKPEKDPKAIAAAAKKAPATYPACQLCIENEGYLGRLDYPARSNHRIVRFDLAGKTWGFQYSPYAYFNEHCIFLDAKHEPMHISRQTFVNLFSIISLFPHYFVGSNADLPIVGGSMLSHEHYQGGRHTFAMAQAPVERHFDWAAFPDVSLGVVKWPMSVLRLEGKDQASLIDAASVILATWRQYSDPSQQIKAVEADGTLHHTVTPIARCLKTGEYQLDLVLRDNQTSAEYPDGIFHPHQDVQHIKRENIGLIEVMGLAILPARLLTELQEVEKYLLQQPNEIADYHRAWADELQEKYSGQLNEENVERLVREEVGQVFARVLADAGVFKRTDAGQTAFDKFVQHVLAAN
ncbi:UDP-glucose--hexose-1-phosphate uridylyltransferase [Lapidilactobacillus luobeiensis]|uniref:UDP-glucose--hexose-1-phosphate uridylyltransferase n=1 Tax=Lapidilactobacillus luobeiensis TaxID=2950371 RepID=UPI0021C43B62|nr:UDP-glucose--hexose-1-phosphate uridylyltransferase [Lapidilactobacillus luobeiensis]